MVLFRDFLNFSEFEVFGCKVQLNVLFRRRFQEALVQSQVRFNRVPEKVPEKVSSQVQRLPEKVAEAKPGQVHLGLTETQLGCFQRLASQHASKRFVNIKRCGCWGYRRSLFSFSFRDVHAPMGFAIGKGCVQPRRSPRGVTVRWAFVPVDVSQGRSERRRLSVNTGRR